MPGKETEFIKILMGSIEADKEQTIIDREDFRDEELEEEIIGKEKSDN
ncbi:hypothetical protein QIA19_05025 (plasmid) [Borreliella finlandensis]